MNKLLLHRDHLGLNEDLRHHHLGLLLNKGDSLGGLRENRGWWEGLGLEESAHGGRGLGLSQKGSSLGERRESRSRRGDGGGWGSIEARRSHNIKSIKVSGR